MLTYTTRTGLASGPLFDAITGLYEIVYAEPPYVEGPEQVARFREALLAEAVRPGFTLVTAEDDGQTVAAAYGWTMPAGTWWSRTATQPPTRVRDTDKFALMEWMVHPARRGEGIGVGVMQRILAGRPERYATLAADPRSHARRLYERSGWRQVGGSALPWGPRMDLLVLNLTGGDTHAGGR